MQSAQSARTLLSCFLLFFTSLYPACAQNGLPPGFSIAAANPNPVNGTTGFGQHVSMTFDSNGDPALAFIVLDENGDGDPSDSRLYFVSWNRAGNRWNAARVVDTVGGIPTGGNLRQVSISRDPSTNLLGIAYIKGKRVAFATSSDGGLSWSSKSASLAVWDSYQSAQPTLVLKGGSVYLTYMQIGTVLVRAGPQSWDPSGWDYYGIPPLGSQNVARNPSLAVDSAGNLAVVAWFNNAAGGMALGYWRLGIGLESLLVVDTGSRAIESPAAQLSFSGLNPRIAFYAPLDDQFGNGKNQVWSTYSNDGGRSWNKAIALPNDGATSMGNRISLALSSISSSAAIASEVVTSDPAASCGEPKFSTSKDLINWSTCSPSGGLEPVMRGQFPIAGFAPDGTLYLTFQNTDSIALPAGVVVWRAGASNTVSPPRIAAGGVVNAANFQGDIAPASVFSIFGSNLALTTVNSATIPLPFSLGGAQVFINGKLAPLFYASTTQLNAQVPADGVLGPATVVVRTAAGDSPPSPVQVKAAAPGLFSYGNNRALAQNQDYSLNGPSNPAAPGSALVAYLTGQGALDNPIATAFAAPSFPLSRPLLAVIASIGSQLANVTFAGLTPGLVGVFQVNLTVPSLPAGDYNLVVSVGGISSNAGLVAIGK
jgi:uncharacterized protein (TIGR03437 family)